MRKLESFMKKHSSMLLSIASGIGLITTTVLAVKATPKAVKLIEDEKKEKNEDLSVFDTVKVAWKPYIPTSISMFSTLICIFGNTYLNYRTQASLISAYAILDKSYKEYVANTKELYGDDADKEIKQKIANTHYDNSKYIHKEDKKLFFEFQTMRYFESTMEELLKAEDMLNQELAATGRVSMNDFFKFLHLKPLSYAEHVGWDDHGDYHEIEFNHEKIVLDDGLECILINMSAWTLDFDDH